MEQTAKQKARVWARRNYYWFRREWAYRYLQPRFIAEEYLQVEGQSPSDYKVFVVDGCPRLIQVDMDRYGDHRRAMMSTRWDMVDLDYIYPRPNDVPVAPKCLPKLLELAGILAQPFSFCRVDFYVLGERILVGEITHYPHSGSGKFSPREWDFTFGRWFSDG